jgi:hypothetical protein
VSGPAAGRPATTPVRAAFWWNVGHAAAGCAPGSPAPGASVYNPGEAALGEPLATLPPPVTSLPLVQAATAQATPISAVPQITARMH